MNKIVSAIAVCAVVAMALSGHAQTQYPSKPVRLLIPFPPGGSTDFAVRVLLLALSPALVVRSAWLYRSYSELSLQTSKTRTPSIGSGSRITSGSASVRRALS